MVVGLVLSTTTRLLSPNKPQPPTSAVSTDNAEMKYELDLTWWRSWYEAGQPQNADTVLEDHALPVKTYQRRYTLCLIDFDDTLFP